MAKLFVIAGHGAGDPGACAHGYQEAERVRALAGRLKALGGDAVTVGDTSRNWYADKGISSLSISKDYCIIELHMDSAGASAKGGHVIIYGGYDADKYDKALAEFISGMFPGRSTTIAKRTDLANPKRAAAKGYNYRLVECCFISNADDLAKFNAQMDDLARGILAAFGIGAQEPSDEPAQTPAQPASGVDLGNKNYWGQKFTREMQKQLGTTVDGIVSGQSKKDKAALPNADTGSWKFVDNPGGSNMVAALQRKVGSTADRYMGKNTVKALQTWLVERGYSVGASGIDGSMGPATCRAVGAALENGEFGR